MRRIDGENLGIIFLIVLVAMLLAFMKFDESITGVSVGSQLKNAIITSDVSVITFDEILEPEIQEDFENEKIEDALYNSGYFRRDIPLDGDTQAMLRAACEENNIQYGLALAVIWKETNYENIVGDSGDSVGYMQVQKKWHEERMATLGVGDLSTPYGNFRVGCNYLSELIDKYGIESALTAYNSGKPGKSNYANAVIAKMKELTE